MAKQSEAQSETVERVMHEFKHHELKGRDGETVTNPKQAIAIGLSEAGASNRNTPAQNLAHPKAAERAGATGRGTAEGSGPNRAELYEEARRRDIPNRSKMNKVQLERALAK